MKKQYTDRTCAPLDRGDHVEVVSGHFKGQQGVVVTFCESMGHENAGEDGGEIMVYMRHAPDWLFQAHNQGDFLHGHATIEEARLGIPAREDCLFCPLTVAFVEEDLFIISKGAGPALIGTPRPRKSPMSELERVGRGIEVTRHPTIGEMADRQLDLTLRSMM